MTPGLRDIAMTLLARGVAMAGPFGVSIVTARVLGPEDRGQYFLIYSYAQIAAQIANLGLHSSNTYLGARRPELVGKLTVNSIYAASIFAPAVALLVVLFLGSPDLLGLPEPASRAANANAFAAVVIAPMLVFYLYVTNMAVGIGKVLLFNALTVLGGVLIVSSSVLTAFAGGGTLAFLLAVAAAFGVTSVVGIHFLLRNVRISFAFDVKLFHQGIAFALRAYMATLFGFLLMRVGILALQQRAGLDEIGQFSITMQIFDALNTIPGVVGLLVFPLLVRTSVSERWPAMWRTFWSVAGFMLLLTVGFALTLPVFIPVIFGEAYLPAVGLTYAILPAVLITSATSILSQYLAAEGFPLRQVLAWLVGLICQSVLSFWLAGEYGAYGVAAALGISSGLVFLILLAETFAAKKRSLPIGSGAGIAANSAKE